MEIKFSPLIKFFERVDEHHLFLIAAGIAFNIILYMIPLLLVGVYFINEFFGADSVSKLIIETAEKILPPNNTTTELLQSTITEVNLIFSQSSFVGWIGIISLLWLSSTLLSSLRSALNRILEIKTTKIFVFYKFKDVFLIILLMIFFTISSYFIPLYSILQSFITEHIKPPYNWYFSQLFLTIVTLVTTFIMFFSIFKFLPNSRVPRSIVLMSTLISVIGIELSRNVFAWYIIRFGTYGKFYGTYAVLISVGVWIYYLSLIMLFSVEISKYIYEWIIIKKKLKQEPDKEIPADSSEF